MNNNPNLGDLQERAIEEIMEFHKMSHDEAQRFFRDIKGWCSQNITNSKWSDKDPNAKAVTSYGLKHICESDLNRYVENNWMKVALYQSHFPIRIEGSRRTITVKDVFSNSTNFLFKDYGV